MHRSGIPLLLAATCIACESSLAERCGTTPVAEPRIAWGEGADGVGMGDTEDTVRSLLGEPNGPWFIDWFGTSHGLLWARGPHAGVQVMFVWRPDNTRDVGFIELVPPYQGRTAEGIGLGSTRAAVECVYGPSERATPGNWYTSGNVLHGIMFEADTVSEIWMYDLAFIYR